MTDTEGKATEGRRRGLEMVEKNVVRRHSFFCVDRKRHTDGRAVVEAVPKTIHVLGREVKGWIVTTEEPVIDKTITLEEAMEGLGVRHDTE